MTRSINSRNIAEQPNYVPGHAVSRYNTDCRLYLSGHTVHWIRQNHATKSEWYYARLLGVEGNWITFEAEGEVLTRWNHDTQQLLAISDAVALIDSVSLRWCPKFRLLGAEFDGGGFSIGLSDHQEQDCLLTARR